MQFIKTLLRLSCLLFAPSVFSQSSLLPQGTKYQHLMERLEIKTGDSALSFLHVRPFSRRELVNAIERYTPNNTGTTDSSLIRSGQEESIFSKVDLAYMQDALMNNAEWVTGDQSAFESRHPLFKTFYKSKADFIQVNTPDFFLAVNPVIQQVQSSESGNSERVFLNSKGATLRGMIGRQVGFDFYLTDNQERTPLFVQDRVNAVHAVPGAGFYKPFKTTAYDYFDARGSVYVNVAKFINLQFGYDKNFIGSGYRSLFLSDYASNNLFFKINTRIWKLNYQNLFMELVPTYNKAGSDLLLPRKYAAMHHLSYDPTKWLNIGLFESVIFGRKDHFEFTYLNPVIFLRSIEQQNGSPDNANVGFDFKATVAHRLQFYGQLMVDEFVLRELKAGNGWWGNKFGVQVGGKYIDAFGVKNLDLQGEINVVRPFTYTHSDSVANYSHYNQPLAHPLGANFAEAIGIIRYQPFPKWQSEFKLIVFRQGIDTGGVNYGGNVLAPYTTRPYEYGWSIGSGVKATGVNASAWIGYEVLDNLFIDGSVLLRKYKVPERTSLSRNTTMFSLGLRLNMFRREYDY